MSTPGATLTALAGRELPGRTRALDLDLDQVVAEAAPALAGAPAETVLDWTLATFARAEVALATSFQLDGMVVLDMALRLEPGLRVITVDTGRLPEATHELIELVRGRYGVKVEVVLPDAGEVAGMVTAHGPNLFYESPDLRLRCCDVRKVRPMRRSLQGMSAWVTGLRRTQGGERAGLQEVEIDPDSGGLVKVNPLARWTRDQVLAYVAAHHVPQSSLYAQGYTSIGCAPCTRAVEPGEDERAGRWWWESGAKECGIHYTLEVSGDGSTRLKAENDKQGGRNV